MTILWSYLQAGYMLYDRVLRPAEVGVTQEVEDNKAAEWWWWYEEMPEQWWVLSGYHSMSFCNMLLLNISFAGWTVFCPARNGLFFSPIIRSFVFYFFLDKKNSSVVWALFLEILIIIVTSFVVEPLHTRTEFRRSRPLLSANHIFLG